MNSIEEDKAVVARNVYFSYGKNEAVKNVSFECGNEFMVIMGPNGSGKTTMIKLIMGLLEPDKGEIKIFGKEPQKMRKLIGYMPQKESIARHFPVLVKDVVLLGINKKIYGRREIERAKRALDKVGLLHLWNEKFSNLSGGQQQRVMFARAIVNEPRIIIMDEPFNGVDIPSRERIMNVVREEKKKGNTIIAVLHNINPVLHDIDKLLLLNREMIAFGHPNDILTEYNLERAYGGTVTTITCREGYCHPLIGDSHG
ncbi:MAG: metal ABC transporter ATP-binding protein [Thermoplasmata archaeon]|nr:metal ABC transporter ATP-binding protein [Thermoplasmata archaeon]